LQHSPLRITINPWFSPLKRFRNGKAGEFASSVL
jgi:hypothetical protein